MDANKSASAIDNRKAILSTLWIFVVFNYLYCDVLGLMDSGLLNQYITGTVNGIEMNQGFLLAAAIFMEISMVMVLLARVLRYRANRWANIFAGAFMTVIQFLTLFVGSGPTGYYLFCSVVEIATTAFIVRYAWTWRQPESVPDDDSVWIAAKPAAHVSDN